jgi:hypothetical protein
MEQLIEERSIEGCSVGLPVHGNSLAGNGSAAITENRPDRAEENNLALVPLSRLLPTPSYRFGIIFPLNSFPVYFVG